MNRSVYVGILLVTALHAFDELVLIVALPTIAPQLNADLQYGLIIASYVLASIVGMSWAGERIDRDGPQRVLRVAVVTFLAGLLLAAVAWDGLSFVAGRILQGLGGGMGWTLTFGLISLLCTPQQQPRALAGMDVAWVLPSLMAPLVGGLLVDLLHWRWVFLVQVPLSLLTLFLIDRRIAGLEGRRGDAKQGVILPSLLIAGGTGLFLYTLSKPPGLWWCLGVVALLLILRPLQVFLPAAWWRLDRSLGVCLVMIFLAFSGFYIAESFQPLYLVQSRGFSSLQAGLALSCASIAWMVGSQAAARGWLYRDYRSRLRLGFGLMCFGLAGLAWVLYGAGGILACYVVWLTIGLGMGICFNTCRVEAMRATGSGEEGLVGATVNLSISLGLSVATGVGGALLNRADRAGDGVVTAIEHIWMTSLGICSVALILLFALSVSRPGRAEQAAPRPSADN
ncbi:MAG: MFS transporter [Pseudomonadota bacterium]